MNAKKAKTVTPAQCTAKVHDALLRVRYATGKEDRNKCGLEYIGNRLDDARGYAEDATKGILPDVADVKLNPAPSLASLCATPPGWTPALNLSELGELIFAQLEKEVALKPDIELLYHGNKRLETFAEDWFVFLFGWNGDGGLAAFKQKKIELAQALGKTGAAKQLLKAFNALLPSFALSDWAKDTKRFASEITPDDFHTAFRKALKLDAEATDEINGTGSREPVKVELVGEQKAQLDSIQHSANTAADYAKIAAAQKLKELNAKSDGGKKGAAVAKAERGEDKERKAILDEAQDMLTKWDESYPNRHKPPKDVQHSDMAAFRIVANKHKGADGKPIMSAATIGRTLRRKKAKNEKRGKYNRTGKKRGKYKPRT